MSENNNISNDEKKEKTNPYETLVLAGGGIKGFSILGAIQAFLDAGLLNIKNYVATSVGAIISYLLIIGYTPIEIVIFLHTNKYLEKIPFMNVVNMLEGNGAIPFLFLQEILEKLTISKIGKFLTMKTLQETFNKNLICVTYNATECVTEYLSASSHPDLPCLVALRMSCNLPLIFERFQYQNCYYLDGGMTDNFPILKASEFEGKILGINFEHSPQNLKDQPEEGIALYFMKLLQIQAGQNMKNILNMLGDRKNILIVSIKIKSIDHSLQFNLNHKHRLDLFSTGYNEAKNAIS